MLAFLQVFLMVFFSLLVVWCITQGFIGTAVFFGFCVLASGNGSVRKG